MISHCTSLITSGVTFFDEAISDWISIKLHLEPLAVAANILQSSDTQLDTMLLTWANLYRIYSDPNLDDVIRTQVLNSLSKRWLQMDQDTFISVVIMNPYIHAKSFACGHPQLSPIGLYNITKHTFVCMFQSDLDLDFCNAFFDYLLDTKEFSCSLMGLADLKQLCEKEVCCCFVSMQGTHHYMWPRNKAFVSWGSQGT